MDIRYIEYRINDSNEQTYLIIMNINNETKTLEMTKNEINTFYKQIFKINEKLKN
jgi:hypothetical protein